ncbi:MAG: amine dehydrogenase, partial [Rhodoblastus sp.]|nr:amine dehydrogenase [Rhodoblastus sp.]
MSGDPVSKLMGVFDRAAESAARKSAQLIGRRSLLSSLGKVLVGGAVLPMLPFDRSARAQGAAPAPEKTDTDCEYWRYCALDGFLCSCCGGSLTSCPPGTEPSTVTWVGT